MVYSNTREVYQELARGRITTVEALQALRSLQLNPGLPALNSPSPEAQERGHDSLQELTHLIGLENVKSIVQEIQAFIQIQEIRKENGLKTEPLVLHMIFKGNPGTGKTTVARILGGLFKELGVLSKGHLIEVERADLVGEYIGHTAQRTREQIKKALGGILFIDEAYALARGGEKDFGKEAIDTLVKAMEDSKNEFILILAGYRREMDRFIKSNPGLSSRFPIMIEFPDYEVSELLDIAELMVKEREYTLSPGAKEYLFNLLKSLSDNYDENRGNARLIRNLIERSIRRQALRLIESEEHLDRESLKILTEIDLKSAAEDTG